MFNLFKKRPTKEKEALDFLIEREWNPSCLKFTLDLEQTEVELESEGFSPEFLQGFNEFCGMLRALYHNAIFGVWPKVRFNSVVNRFFLEYSDGLDYPTIVLSSDRIPDAEHYKLADTDGMLGREYVVARAAKTLIKLSPVGEAISKYREEHPLPDEYPNEDCKREGTFMKYNPSIYGWIHGFSPTGHLKTPWLNGSDAGEADFYYAARDLLKDESRLLNLKMDEDEQRANTIRANLIGQGIRIPFTYASKFRTAKRKIEKYGIDSLEKYFVRGEVGENDKDGQLVLFGPNEPKGTRWVSF